MTRTHLVRGPFILLLALAATLSFTPAAQAQVIKQPGNHPNYAVELDPHLLAQYGNVPYTGDGWGAGLRASIPFVQNGPIPTINNNIGISFGFDFVHFGDDGTCNGRGYPVFYPDSCNATELWFPVTGQWNFFLTKVISVFGEFGLSAHYVRWGYEGLDNNGRATEFHTSHLDLFEPVLWGGGRFLFGRNAGLTVRLGWPYISVGASILF